MWALDEQYIPGINGEYTVIIYLKIYISKPLIFYKIIS